MLATNDAVLAERCRGARNLFFNNQQRFVHHELGWNMRMTNMQAALGLAQIEQIDGFVKRKRDMGRRYTELLSNTPGLELPLAETDYSQNIYWVYGIVLADDMSSPREVMAALGEQKIGTRPFFWPMHEQPVLLKMGLFNGVRCPVAERLARRGFYVPSGLALEDSEIRAVASALHDILVTS